MSNSSPPAAIPGTNGNTVNDDSGMLDPARAVLPLHPTFFFGLPTRKALVASKSHPRDEEEADGEGRDGREESQHEPPEDAEGGEIGDGSE